MSAITIENDLVHYEVLGRGRPVILVHGWLSSWRYWIPTMQQLSMKYRTYALDLWGYGDSGKNPDRFGLEAHVKLLDDFMEKMGIGKAALIGHSLGAAVVIRYALQQPDRAARLMAISTPLFEMAPGMGSSALEAEAPALDQPPAANPAMAAENIGLPWLEPGEELLDEEITRPIEAIPPEPEPDVPPAGAPTAATPEGNPLAGGTNDALSAAVRVTNSILRERLSGVEARQLLERYLDRDVPDYDKLSMEAAKVAATALASSAMSFDRVALAQEVRRLSKPTLLVHGEKDAFLPPPSRGLIDSLAHGKGDFRCVIWPETNHFPMLDDPSTFHRLVMDFLETSDLDDLEFKERWVRKVR